MDEHLKQLEREFLLANNDTNRAWCVEHIGYDPCQHSDHLPVFLTKEDADAFFSEGRVWNRAAYGYATATGEGIA